MRRYKRDDVVKIAIVVAVLSCIWFVNKCSADVDQESFILIGENSTVIAYAIDHSILIEQSLSRSTFYGSFRLRQQQCCRANQM